MLSVFCGFCVVRCVGWSWFTEYRPLEDPSRGLYHVGGDRILVPLAVEHDPPLLARLAMVAVANACLHREVAFVAIAVDGLAGHRGLRRDVEQDGQRRR